MTPICHQRTQHGSQSPRLFDRALVAEEAGDALARAGDTAEARPWFEEALAGYKAFDATWDASRVAARMRSFGMRRGVRPASRPCPPGDRWVPTVTVEPLSPRTTNSLSGFA